jgi:hypothetical protein
LTKKLHEKYFPHGHYEDILTMGSSSISNFGTRWRWSVSRPAIFCLEKQVKFSFSDRMNGPISQTRVFDKEKNFLSQSGNEPPFFDLSVLNLAILARKLYRLPRYQPYEVKTDCGLMSVYFTGDSGFAMMLLMAD